MHCPALPLHQCGERDIFQHRAAHRLMGLPSPIIVPAEGDDLPIREGERGVRMPLCQWQRQQREHREGHH
jgi:hypothetical protein